ncbi:hypothetical protein BY996DRAFT_7138568 [Phakopsora pachyrhizi]|uniref:Expressed protein n=1 Tax=Phakopsora pachyrhizi TaxID=170000 RepID=A0AAV0AP32_PHAPC|nr:hypothetical protein BY996DRAFT_7138568 [Phakopsora pachyrhizi]CAH7669508.1 expressed protein [Phakopsora pachyrhizi]
MQKDEKKKKEKKERKKKQIFFALMIIMFLVYAVKIVNYAFSYCIFVITMNVPFFLAEPQIIIPLPLSFRKKKLLKDTD